MSALRHGKIERAIATEIARAAKPSFGGVSSVLIRSRQLVDEVYRPKGGSGGWDWDWKPMPAQRKGVVRAMHSFVRKHQQYALAGGQGHRELYLYDTTDPVSVMWAKLNAERRQRNPLSRSDAQAAMRERAG